MRILPRKNVLNVADLKLKVRPQAIQAQLVEVRAVTVKSAKYPFPLVKCHK